MHFGSNNFEFGQLFVLVGTLFVMKRKKKLKKKSSLNLYEAKSSIISFLVGGWGGEG